MQKELNVSASDYLIRGTDYLAKAPGFKLVGRDEELKELTGVLMRKRANSVLIVGPGGVGCSALAMGLQDSKNDPNAPFDIVGKRFFWLDTDGLFASGDSAMINNSFQKAIKTLTRATDAVLVIDDMKDFVEAARNNGCSNLINAMMREVKNGSFQAIFETTDEDLPAVIKCHSDMQESYTLVDVNEPSEDNLPEIVAQASERLSTHHKIKISEDAIAAAIEVTNKYRVRDLGLSRAQPERSTTLIDRALTAYRMDAHAQDPRLSELEARLESANKMLGDESYSADQGGKSREELEALQASLQTEIAEINESWDERQKKIKSYHREIRDAEEQIRSLEDDIAEAEALDQEKLAQDMEEGAEIIQQPEEERGFRSFASRTASAGFDSPAVKALKQQKAGFVDAVKSYREKFDALSAEVNDTLELTREHVFAEFSRISGIPVNKLTEDERAKLLGLEENLGNRVFGQEEAVSKLSNQILVSYAGLKDPNKPKGAFLFLGPSGVGKTEIAKAATAELNGDERSLLRFDMSEYMEKHAVAKLIGAPPGYEGYEAGGILTNEMRRNPRRIILFDEIEKAHPDVFNVFLQILDEGRLTDNRGLTVSFGESLIMMTSNTGKEHFLNLPFDEAKANALEDLDDFLPPELLNRFNGRQNIVCFNKLDLPVIELIARRDIGKLNKMVQAANPGISVKMDDEALAAMCRDHYKPVNGARGITGYIEGQIKPEIARTVLFAEGAEGVIEIDYDQDSKKVVLHPPKTIEQAIALDEKPEAVSAKAAFQPQ